MSEYIIVIDVDNVRAEKAFKKGVEELTEIWPQIDHWCSLQEQVKLEEEAELERLVEERRKRMLACEKEADEKYAIDLAKYKKDVEEFESSWFRTVPPLKPFREYVPTYYTENISSYMGNVYDIYVPRRSYYESIIARLKRMHTVASHATGPYRMTEHDVIDMAGWEDGSKVAKILEEISK